MWEAKYSTKLPAATRLAGTGKNLITQNIKVK
jgi:hypothetical protein